MFRWKRAFSTQLIAIILVSLCLAGCSNVRVNWMYKKAEVDLQTLENPAQYQQDYVECNAYARAYRNGYSTIATKTALGLIGGAVSGALIPMGADVATSTLVGGTAGGLGGYLWSSWSTNHKINRDTAICLINRGYDILDKDWWIRMRKIGFHGD